MRLVNITKSTIISSDLKTASSLLDKIFGLLKANNPRSLLFKTRFGVHTLGLKEPIDILVLNKNLKVVKLREKVLPNRLFFWSPCFDQVIELPEHYIKKSLTEVGDYLEIVSS